jgi:hypothetical protein
LCRDVNASVEEYFINGYGETATVSPSSSTGSKVQQTFDKYKDGSTGNIEIEGLQKFFDDLGVNAASDTVTFLISYKMNAQSMGVLTL